MFDTRTDSDLYGVYLRKSSSGLLRWYYKNTAGTDFVQASGAVPHNTDCVTCVSGDGSNIRMWVGGSSTSDLSSFTPATDTSLEVDQHCHILGNFTGGLVSDDTSLHAIAMGTDYLTDTGYEDLVEKLEFDTGRTYL